MERPATPLEQAVVVDVEARERHIPLRTAYGLSFATLSSYRAITLHLTLSTGETSVGEVVPLPGYSAETAESVLDAVSHSARALLGKTLGAGRCRTVVDLNGQPMAASVLLGAIDYPIIRRRWAADFVQFRVPILTTISASDPAAIDRLIEARASGYRTVKVKLGERIEADLAFIAQCAGLREPLPRLRFDANQAYTPAQARRVLAVLESLAEGMCELLEQPLPSDAWADMALLARDTCIPLMLDESINTLADIERAEQAGCSFVKLKLCKQGGVWEVLRAARHARRHGLGVVFGNGVATDVANFLELATAARYPRLFHAPLESVGFARITESLGENRLFASGGIAILDKVN